MTVYARIRRQQFIREAEGYLDLILTVSEPFSIDPVHRDRLAKRAIAVLDKLDDEEVHHGRVHYLRGQAFRLMGKYHQAIDSLLRAAELEPSNVHIYLSLAWCYKRVGRIDLAIQSLEDALEIDPDRSILHYNLACYWSLAQNVGLTLAHLARALEMNETYRDLVADEPDFDPVRNHPEFLALTAIRV